MAQKTNRNTKQNSVNPSNSAHMCRTREHARDANSRVCTVLCSYYAYCAERY